MKKVLKQSFTRQGTGACPKSFSHLANDIQPVGWWYAPFGRWYAMICIDDIHAFCVILPAARQGTGACPRDFRDVEGAIPYRDKVAPFHYSLSVFLGISRTPSPTRRSRTFHYSLSVFFGMSRTPSPTKRWNSSFDFIIH